MEAFILSLPDPQAADVFLERLVAQHPVHAEKCKRDPLLLSRLLTVVTHSPFLAENLLRHPEDIDWFGRETRRDIGSLKTIEQLSEDLSRFVTRLFDADSHTQLARFKNREFLRIFLRDCLNIATLAEITEELSNLADVLIGYALKQAMQAVTNKHGAPQTKDERGRISSAEFAIIALGKLGCRELNYASDIDLMFLYAGVGETAGDGRAKDSVVSNKEFFTRVAQRVVKMIGGLAVENSVYRVDLRLRPYGRDGDMVWEVGGAADYYHNKAQSWERQMLIRARATAGSEAVFTSFFEAVRDTVFTASPHPEAVAEVRRIKEKIDRKVARQTGGFNVKLGLGGIRDIEFIAQALQLAHGGREPWVRSGVRSAQTLIVLARLAEKRHLSEQERAALSSAYSFFRIVEHRLQMENGAQTHTLPIDRERVELLARRCGYAAPPAAAATAFRRDVEVHAEKVRDIYNRVFASEIGASAGGNVGNIEVRDASSTDRRVVEITSRMNDAEEMWTTNGEASFTVRTTEHHQVQLAAQREMAPQTGDTEREFDDEASRLIQHAASAIQKLLAARQGEEKPAMTAMTGDAPSSIESQMARSLQAAINPIRSLKNLISWTDSFSTYSAAEARAVLQMMSDDLPAFLQRLLAVFSSQYLSSILVARPLLVSSLVETPELRTTDYFTAALKKILNESSGVAEKADALRRAWHEMIVGIGYGDVSGIGGRGAEGRNTKPGVTEAATGATDNDHLRKSNLEQSALAEAALRLASEIILESLGVRESLPFVVMGLGRLGHSGMDYGSDLDLLIVFDDSIDWAEIKAKEEALQTYGTAQEFYAKFTAEVLRLLSSITREGFIYRVDLRLRPEGKNGQLAQGLQSLITYLRERASAWEHSAYLKVRAVAGDLQLGKRTEKQICEAIFAAASENLSLNEDLKAMRLRLEREKAKGNWRDIKWGAGGMTDVYFITRYLQLRDRVIYPTRHGTLALIDHLYTLGALDAAASQKLVDGYLFLRRLDHWMRLLLDRPTSVLPASQIARADLARSLRLPSVEAFEREYARHTLAIREVFKSIFP